MQDVSEKLPLILSRYQMRRALGEALVLNIDPRAVKLHAGPIQTFTFPARKVLSALERRNKQLKPATVLVKKVFHRFEPFRLKQRSFDHSIAVESEPRYVLLEDFINHRDRVERSLWFRNLRHSLSLHGGAFHKSIELRDEHEITNFLHGYARELVDSLECTGYDPSRATDIGQAIIDRDGAIHKTDKANHRFAAARILGTRRFPLVILGVHRAWFHRHVPALRTEELCAELRRVEVAHRSG